MKTEQLNWPQTYVYIHWVRVVFEMKMTSSTLRVFSATSDETLRREIPSFLGRSVSRAPPAVPASTTLKSLNRIKHNICIFKPASSLIITRITATIVLLTFVFYESIEFLLTIRKEHDYIFKLLLKKMTIIRY